MHADYLIVALTLPGIERPVICIPHGSGGLHRRDDFRTFEARITRANNPDDYPDTLRMHPGGAVGRSFSTEGLVYLAYHAVGCVASRVSLVGAHAAPATLVQRKVLEVRSQLHRQSYDAHRRAHDQLLPIADAVELVERLPRMLEHARGCAREGCRPACWREDNPCRRSHKKSTSAEDRSSAPND